MPRKMPDAIGDQVEVEALARSVVAEFENYVKLNKKISPEVVGAVTQIDDYSKLADTVASHLAIKIPEKQAMLALPTVVERLERVLGLMESEISVLQVEKRIRSRVKRQMEKTQREYYLNEQMKAIQKELGDSEDGRDELAELEEKIAKTKLSKEAREKAQNELKKLRQMSPMSAEATVVRNYLDWLLGIPWGKKSKVKNDLNFAQEVLDADHFGLEKVKDRIVEYLAVQSRSNKLQGPDPLPRRPSRRRQDLARQVDREGDRPRVRAHVARRRARRGRDPRPPAHLYRLDARQGHPVDAQGQEGPIRSSCSTRSTRSAWTSAAIRRRRCSRCSTPSRTRRSTTTISRSTTTCRTCCSSPRRTRSTFPPPLMDRMEIIRIAGYTEDEKIEIARRHLMPKILKEHGLQREGVLARRRGPARRSSGATRARPACAISSARSRRLARKGVKDLILSKKKSIKITAKNVEDFLGVPRYRYGEAELEDLVGVVTGLAWTEVGGELLTIEGVMMPGKGRMTVTGNLRDVMKESISAAASYVRSRAIDFGIEPPLFDKRDIHVHVPGGRDARRTVRRPASPWSRRSSRS